MSRDAFLSEALYEADKALEKFAWKVHCSAVWVCVFIRWQTEQTVNRKCMFYFVILRCMSTNRLHLCLRLLCRLLHCCIAANRQVSIQQDCKVLTCSDEYLTQPSTPTSHLNVILLFLTDCGILQFTPSLRSEQNGTAPS